MHNLLRCRPGKSGTLSSFLLLGIVALTFAQLGWTQEATIPNPDPPDSTPEIPAPPSLTPEEINDPALSETPPIPESVIAEAMPPPTPAVEEEVTTPGPETASIESAATDGVTEDAGTSEPDVSASTPTPPLETAPDTTQEAQEEAPQQLSSTAVQPVESFLDRATRDGTGYQSQYGPSFWEMCLKALQALAIVLLLIIVTAWALRRFGGRKLIGRPGSPGEVIGRIFLDPRNLLYLVKIQDRILVIGRSPTGLQLMTEITNAEQVRALVSKKKAQAAGGGTLTAFPKVLEGMSSKPRAETPPSSTEMEKSLAEIRSEIERLSQFSEEIDDD